MNKLGDIKLAISLALFLTFFPVNSLFAQKGVVIRKITQSNNAYYDLSRSDFDNNVFALYGNWEFYWKKLLTPDQIKNTRTKQYVNVPSTWTAYKINNQYLPSFGYATYHIRVKLPEDYHNIALSTHGIFTSYKLFVNGQLIDENGKVGTDKKHQKGTWLPKTYIIHSNSDTLDIVLQVSNFIHFKGGVVRQMVIGSPQAVFRYSMLGIAYEASLIGAMLIMALYFLFFFYNQPNNISSLYLALVLISQAIITGLDGEYIIFRIFPHLNLAFAVKLLYALFFYRTILFIHYIYHLVPKEINIKTVLIATGIYFIMTLYVIFLPIKHFEFALKFYIVTAFLLGIYMIYALLKLIKYNIGSLYTLLGLAALIATGVNDALYDFGIIHTFYMTGLGFLIFIFVLSMMIAMHNAKAQGQVLAYSLLLRKLNILRENLIKIPFYDLSGALKIITGVLNVTRGIWIDKSQNQYIVKYEEYLNTSKTVGLPINDLPEDYLCKNSVKLAGKYNKVIQYSITPKDLRKAKRSKFSNQISKYLVRKKYTALAVAPISKDSEIKSILYIENRYKPINPIQKRLIFSIRAQLATLKENADSYQKLQEIKEKLEKLVDERTQLLKTKEKELQEKEVQLKEKVEELKAYNEQINQIHKELEKHKYEIELRNFELEKLHNEIYTQKELAEQQNQRLTNEIKFAEKIQKHVLRVEPNLPFTDLFILYLPKQIVSGDFYWMRRFENKIVIAVADCTGHGVPGAFMSILGTTLLNEVLNKFYMQDPQLKVSAAQILDELRAQVIKTLGQEDTDESAKIKDGMDIALAIYDENTQGLQFAGAYLTATIVRDNEIIELKGDRQPIGVYHKPNLKRNFTNHFMTLKRGDALYMYSDGYSDQFNPSGIKFYRKNLRKLLLEISQYPGSIQRDILEKVFRDWKGDHYQVDDILILGIII